VFTRMLDNVVEMSGLPLEQQRHEIENKRRHGMGFLGLGSTLTMLRMKYGSTEAVEFTERVSRELALTGLARPGSSWPRKRTGSDHERGVHGHRGNAGKAPGNGA
jgi:hypothetical protein